MSRMIGGIYEVLCRDGFRSHDAHTKFHKVGEIGGEWRSHTITIFFQFKKSGLNTVKQRQNEKRELIFVYDVILGVTSGEYWSVAFSEVSKVKAICCVR
jgi:hypothetical protein